MQHVMMYLRHLTPCSTFYTVLSQFIALYDYDPVKSSPCDHPEFELALSEGDLLKVYGREMEDGFIVGEVRARTEVVCMEGPG